MPPPPPVLRPWALGPQKQKPGAPLKKILAPHPAQGFSSLRLSLQAGRLVLCCDLLFLRRCVCVWTYIANNDTGPSSAPVKVSVMTRVMSGRKLLANDGKRYDEAATVKIIVDCAIAKLSDPTAELLNVESFASQDAMEKPPGVELDDLHDVTAAHLYEDLGRFLLTRVRISARRHTC